MCSQTVANLRALLEDRVPPRTVWLHPGYTIPEPRVSGGQRENLLTPQETGKREGEGAYAGREQMVRYKGPKRMKKPSWRQQMSKAEEDREALVRAGEAREAGVADLMSFYARVEGIHAAASRALEENQIGSTTNAANPPHSR